MFQWLVPGFVSLLVTCACVHGEIYASSFKTNVKNNSNPTFLDFFCPLHSWIHVTKITYDRPESCKAYPLPGCTTSIDVLTKSVNKECIGQAACQRNVQLPQMKWSSFQLNLDYECIADNRLDICDGTIENKRLSAVFFLHSHGYPNSRGVPDNCSCTITGDDIKMTALEVNLPYSNSKFVVRGDTPVGLSSQVDQYDVDMLHNARRVQVMYFNGGVKDQNVWLEVSYSSIVTVSCGESRPPPPPPPPPPQQPYLQGKLPPDPVVKTGLPIRKTKVPPSPAVQSRRPDVYATSLSPVGRTTSSQNTNIDDYLDDEEDDSRPWIIVAIVLGVVLVCIIIVVIVVVIIKRRKGRLFSRSVSEVPKSSRSLPEVPKMTDTGPIHPAVPQRQDSGSYANPYLELTNTNNIYSQLGRQYPQVEEHKYSGIKTGPNDLYLTPQPAYTDAM